MMFKETFTKVNRESKSVIGTETVEFDMAKLPTASLYHAAARGFHEQIMDAYAGAKTAEDFSAAVGTKLANILAGKVSGDGTARGPRITDPIAREVKRIVGEKLAAWHVERKKAGKPKASKSLADIWLERFMELHGDTVREQAEAAIAAQKAFSVPDDFLDGLEEEEGEPEEDDVT